MLDAHPGWLVRAVPSVIEGRSATSDRIVCLVGSGYPRFGFVEHTEEAFFAGQGFNLCRREPT